jgi:hypothetical protein
MSLSEFHSNSELYFWFIIEFAFEFLLVKNHLFILGYFSRSTCLQYRYGDMKEATIFNLKCTRRVSILVATRSKVRTNTRVYPKVSGLCR